jgi:hypothetical protein
MATITPSFSWPVPTSSDLVKNGATAIEALGDAIDASMTDLKGGTTNQVLAKNSNTDMDFKWVSDATGMTNPMTTTGDVIYSSSGSTPDRLGIGTAGQVLTVNSGATAPEWATPSSGGSTFVGVKLKATSSQSISNNTDTAFIFDVEDFDTDGFHSNVTNNTRITIPAGKAGYYQIGGLCDFSNAATGTNTLSIYKNGVNTKNFFGAPNTVYPSGILETVLYLAVGDYVELFTKQTSGTSQSHYVDSLNGQFYAFYIGA